MLVKLPIVSGFIMDDFRGIRYPVKFVSTISNVILHKDTYVIVAMPDDYIIPNLSSFLYVLYNKKGAKY